MNIFAVKNHVSNSDIIECATPMFDLVITRSFFSLLFLVLFPIEYMKIIFHTRIKDRIEMCVFIKILIDSQHFSN